MIIRSSRPGYNMNSKETGMKRRLLQNVGIGLALMAMFLMSGCDLGEEGERDIKLSHRAHIEKRQMECVDCHEGAEDSDDPGMPDEKLCLTCHTKLDKALKGKDAPFSKKCLYCHNPKEEQLAKGQKVVLGPGRAKDLTHAHAKHFDKEVECSSCHGNIAKDGNALLPRDDYMPTTKMCLDCHAKKNVSADCSTCHKAAKRLEPEAHQANWIKRHGMESEFAEGGHGKDCSTCHAKRECVECHTQTAPKDHTNFWRTRGHGIEARMDRERCLTCHKQDSCVRCHSETVPRNHRGAWLDNHCRACHLKSSFTPENNRCAVCHRQIPHVVP